MLKTRRQAGYSTVEITVAAAITMLVAGGSMSTIESGGESWKKVVRKTKAQSEVRETLTRVVAHLKTAINVSIDKIDPTRTKITFQTPLGKSGDKVEYGAIVRNVSGGQTRATPMRGYWAQYVVVDTKTKSGDIERQLVLRTLDPDRQMVVGVDKIIARNVDTTGGSLPGFDVTKSGGLYSLSIRVGDKNDGRVEVESSVAAEKIEPTSIDNSEDPEKREGLATASLSTQLLDLQKLLAASLTKPLVAAELAAAVALLEAARTSVGDNDLISAMSNMTEAIDGIDGAMASGLNRTDATRLMDGLAVVAREYAKTAVANAVKANALPTYIDSANSYIDAGDSYRAAAKFGLAAAKYDKAVNEVY